MGLQGRERRDRHVKPGPSRSRADGIDGRALIPAVTFLTVAVGESDGRPALIVKKNVHLRSRAKAYSILSGIVMCPVKDCLVHMNYGVYWYLLRIKWIS